MSCDERTPEDSLATLDRQHLRRRRHTVEAFPESGSRVEVVIDGRRLVDFCSNDYLGLARHPVIASAMSEAAVRYGAGSGASHLVTGHGIEHARLEEEIAAFTGRERAVLFSTGYMANVGAITSLAARGDHLLLDRLNHASLIDAAQLSGARFRRYAHNDAPAVERALQAFAEKGASERRALIITDGVFSMDGDMAPVRELALICRKYSAYLVVDDAHGVGVVGASGRGTLERSGLSAKDVPVLIGTFGKAFGSFGAFVAGHDGLIEWIVQKARPYIYTTALPQPVAAATRAALKLAQSEPWRRARVLELASRFSKAARQLDLPLTASETPIQPVVLGSAEVALRAQSLLAEAGFWVSAIRPPTVPAGSSRLRITFSAAHTETQVDRLLDALSRIRDALAT
jgi:8-amino-7-oxononanoate synthase